MQSWNTTSYSKKNWSFLIFYVDFWRFSAKRAENI